VYVIAVTAFDLQDMEGDFSAPITVLTP